MFSATDNIPAKSMVVAAAAAGKLLERTKVKEASVSDLRSLSRPLYGR